MLAFEVLLKLCTDYGTAPAGSYYQTGLIVGHRNKLTHVLPAIMKEVGLGLLVIGLISLVLLLINPTIHYVFLTGIDQWGTAVAQGIRGGITLLGLVLWLGFKNRD